MKKEVTIKEVALEAGVSIATISRFLNNKKEHMSKQTAKRVEKAIKKLDYVPNESARQLITKKSKVIAVLVANVNDYFSTEIFKGVNKILEKYDYTAILLDSNGSKERERDILAEIEKREIGGIVLQPLNTSIKVLNGVLDKNIPTVIVDRKLKDSDWPSVLTNNYDISKEASEYFYKNGLHEVIVITNTIKNISTREERLAGIKSVYNNPIIITPGNDKEQYDKAFADISQKLLKNPDTLVFSLKEKWLLEFLPKMIRTKLINKNKATKITGFSDTNLTVDIDPDIITIKQSPLMLGQKAANIIIKSIENDEFDDNSMIIIPAKFN